MNKKVVFTRELELLKKSATAPSEKKSVNCRFGLSWRFILI